MAQVPLFGLRKVDTRPWPDRQVAASSTPQTANIDLKDLLPSQFISLLLLRVTGSIIIAGAGGGVATGKENPEALVLSVTARHTPTFGAIGKNNLSAVGIINQGIFDRGYAIRETDVPDAAATVAVDFSLVLVQKMPGSVDPKEWILPMSAFDTYQLSLLCGGKEQLFTGGVNTWDLTGLNIEVWADFDESVEGKFHIMEEFEQTIPVTQSQTDLKVTLDKGWLYTHLLFIAQRDNANVDDIINNITVQSGGRIWTPQGDRNAKLIHRFNRETHVNSAAESLTGVYFIAALRDGMITRAIDASDQKLEVLLDVTLGAGTTRQVILHGRRIIPVALG